MVSASILWNTSCPLAVNIIFKITIFKCYCLTTRQTNTTDCQCVTCNVMCLTIISISLSTTKSNCAFSGSNIKLIILTIVNSYIIVGIITLQSINTTIGWCFWQDTNVVSTNIDWSLNWIALCILTSEDRISSISILDVPLEVSLIKGISV